MSSTIPTAPSLLRENTSTTPAGQQQPARPDATMVELTGMQGVVADLMAAAAEKKRATQLYDALVELIKKRIGTAEIGTLDGQPVVTYTRSERIILRDKLVRELFPDVARECEDIIPVRTFRLLD
ncbi:hypothetical protein ACFQ1S_00460 [Kibdelosporangium lantanae]|uniref:Uncharacterized protein n=1 Tax=Kibdelosporangium lantanae TaxID=1497396 RepID=A0ABW3M1L5_9PSEU